MSVIAVLLGFLIAFYIGFFAVSIFAKNTELSFRALFAIPLGFGFCSIFYFTAMLLNMYNFKIYIGLEILILLALGIVYYFKNQQKPLQIVCHSVCSQSGAQPKNLWCKAKYFSSEIFQSLRSFKMTKQAIILSIVTLYSILIYTRYYMQNTLGSWDGFRIWNIKSEFLFQNSELWRNVFKLPHFMMHNDYPLFLPATNARLWKYAGVDSTGINAFLGLFFTLGIIYLLYFAIKKYKNAKLALIVTSVFALITTFIVNGAAQCADIPMAFMALCSVVAGFLYFERKENVFLVLGILFAGLTAWTKNEGMMYLLAYSGALGLMLLWIKEYKKFLVAAASLLPFVVLLGVFKLTAKAPNDLFMGVVLLKTYKNFFDISLYWYIFKYIIKVIFMDFYMLFPLLLLAIRGFKIEDKNKLQFIFLSIIVFTMCIGYFVVYLISPHDLQWLLENSLSRIILQILPIIVLLYTLSLKFLNDEIEE